MPDPAAGGPLHARHRAVRGRRDARRRGAVPGRARRASRTPAGRASRSPRRCSRSGATPRRPSEAAELASDDPLAVIACRTELFARIAGGRRAPARRPRWSERARRGCRTRSSTCSPRGSSSPARGRDRRSRLSVEAVGAAGGDARGAAAGPGLRGLRNAARAAGAHARWASASGASCSPRCTCGAGSWPRRAKQWMAVCRRQPDARALLGLARVAAAQRHAARGERLRGGRARRAIPTTRPRRACSRRPRPCSRSADACDPRKACRSCRRSFKFPRRASMTIVNASARRPMDWTASHVFREKTPYELADPAYQEPFGPIESDAVSNQRRRRRRRVSV